LVSIRWTTPSPWFG